MQDDVPIHLHRFRAHWLALGLVLPLGAATPARDPADAQAVIAKFKVKDPDLVKVFAGARGYAVYPTVGKGAIGIGGARGKEYVYEHRASSSAGARSPR